MFGKYVKPHGSTIKTMVKLGFLKRVSSRYHAIQNNPTVGVNELFMWYGRIYVLIRKPYEPFPQVFEMINWVNDIEVVTYSNTNKVGIIHKGEKKVIKNVSKMFGGNI